MTNKQALLSEIHPYHAPDVLVEKALLDSEITGEEAYASSGRAQIYKAAYAVLSSLLSLTGISEGDFSINYDPKGLKERLIALAKKSGDEDLIAEAEALKPKIKNATNRW